MKTLLCGLLVLSLAPAIAQAQWRLIWNDEFNGNAGTKPDATKWTYDLGAGGWGNQELETYTNSAENAHLDGSGNLVIHVAATSGGYTSARLKTQGVFTAQYGRIETRVKIPFGQGIWPAFWMLGANIDRVGWPQCGEIDIMESIGKEPSVNHGSLHGPGYSGGNPRTATYTLPKGQKFSDAFHTFAIQWSAQAVTFYVDGTLYETVTPSAIPAGTQWVFNAPFFLLLNVAVGGTFPGNPDATSQFPQDMIVDYVRVYQAASVPAAAIAPGGVVDAASYGAPLAPGSVASIFGTSLSPATNDHTFDPARGSFATSASGTSVLVNGAASPLTYVSPGQINFQVPLETITGNKLNVEVLNDGILGNAAPVTLDTVAPSSFAIGCTGADCTLWGNGFGTAPAACKLAIAGIDARVTYCGPAPGLIIDQLNFVYPDGVPNGPGSARGVLTVAGVTVPISVPSVSRALL